MSCESLEMPIKVACFDGSARWDGWKHFVHTRAAFTGSASAPIIHFYSASWLLSLFRDLCSSLTTCRFRCFSPALSTLILLQRPLSARRPRVQLRVTVDRVLRGFSLGFTAERVLQGFSLGLQPTNFSDSSVRVTGDRLLQRFHYLKSGGIWDADEAGEFWYSFAVTLRGENKWKPDFPFLGWESCIWGACGARGSVVFLFTLVIVVRRNKYTTLVQWLTSEKKPQWSTLEKRKPPCPARFSLFWLRAACREFQPNGDRIFLW